MFVSLSVCWCMVLACLSLYPHVGNIGLYACRQLRFIRTSLLSSCLSFRVCVSSCGCGCVYVCEVAVLCLCVFQSVCTCD